MKKIRKVQITWSDSTQEKTVWHDLNDLIDMADPDEFKTIGYLIRKNKNTYLLAHSLHFEDGEPLRGGGIFQIPTGCIKKVEYL